MGTLLFFVNQCTQTLLNSQCFTCDDYSNSHELVVYYVSVSVHTCMQVLEEARRGHQIPWSWSNGVTESWELPEVDAGI